MRQIAFAQFSAERPRLSVSDCGVIDPDDRQEIDDGARQKRFARRLCFSHRERPLDKAVTIPANNIEDCEAGDAVEDGVVGLTGDDGGVHGNDPGIRRGSLTDLPLVINLPSLKETSLLRRLLAKLI